MNPLLSTCCDDYISSNKINLYIFCNHPTPWIMFPWGTLKKFILCIVIIAFLRPHFSEVIHQIFIIFHCLVISLRYLVEQLSFLVCAFTFFTLLQTWLSVRWYLLRHSVNSSRGLSMLPLWGTGLLMKYMKIGYTTANWICTCLAIIACEECVSSYYISLQSFQPNSSFS